MHPFWIVDCRLQIMDLCTCRLTFALTLREPNFLLAFYIRLLPPVADQCESGQIQLQENVWCESSHVGAPRSHFAGMPKREDLIEIVDSRRATALPIKDGGQAAYKWSRSQPKALTICSGTRMRKEGLVTLYHLFVFSGFPCVARLCGSL